MIRYGRSWRNGWDAIPIDVCPACDGRRGWLNREGRWQGCGHCDATGIQVSVAPLGLEPRKVRREKARERRRKRR